MPVLLISSQDVVEAVQPSNEDEQNAQDQEMSHMLRDDSGLLHCDPCSNSFQ